MSTEYGERINYQVVVTTASEEAKTRAFRRLQQGKIRPLAALWEDPKNPVAGLDEAQLKAKLQETLYHCFIAVIVESRDSDRLPILAQAARDIEQFCRSGHNRLVAALESEPFIVESTGVAFESDVMRLLNRWKRKQSTAWRQVLCVLSAPELTALWHLPSANYEGDEIAWSYGDIPDAVFDPTDAVPLGEMTIPGLRGKTVYLKARDRRTHHYITGVPDAGKSTLLLRLIQADISAGHGLAVIDPHGKLIHDIIDGAIPPERRDDVVLLDMRREDFPVPLNPFRVSPDVRISEAMNYLVFALQKIYEDIWLTGRTESYIINAVQLLLTDPESTPLDIYRVFQDKAYRAELLVNLSLNGDAQGLPVQSLKLFWELYEAQTVGEKDKILTPIVTRTQAFTRTGLLELMMCHPKTLEYRRLMNEKKIVLIDMSGNELRQDVDNLATLLVSGFFLGAFSLGPHPDDLPPRFYLYVDEMERVVTAPFTHVFSESRKYGLSAILANQFLAQIPEKTLKAIIGTVGTKTIFQVGIDDARFLAPYYEPGMTHTNLVNLHLHRIAVRMRRDKINLPPIVLQTQKITPLTASVTIEELRRKIEHEFLPASKVREWRSTRNTPLKDTEPSPKRAKGAAMGRTETVSDSEPHE